MSTNIYEIEAAHKKLRENTPLYLKEWIEQNEKLGDLIDDLDAVIEALREEKNYVLSDRLRVLAGRLANMRKPQFDREGKTLIRQIAKSWKK